MYSRTYPFLAAVGLLWSAYASLGAPTRKAHSPPLWRVGDEWALAVKQYSQDWAADFSDPKQNRLKNIPRIQHEYHMTVRVASVETSGGQTLARLEFTPGVDAPRHFWGDRYTLTIDMDTLLVARAECTKGERGKFLPWAVRADGGIHKALFTHALGFPVDWVIERDDVESPGVQCFLGRRPAKPGARAQWEQINAADLDRETPHTYGTEFRRTVTRSADGNAIKVLVFQRDAFQQTPSDEVEQLWDPKVGWWRSFTRRRDGHLDLEATLISE